MSELEKKDPEIKPGPHRFQKGNPGGPGGPPGGHPGSGRPPNYIRREAREIVHKFKLIERMGQIANGEDLPTGKDKTNLEPAALRDQIKASELLLNRGDGLPGQEITHKGEAVDSIRESLESIREIVEGEDKSSL